MLDTIYYFQIGVFVLNEATPECVPLAHMPQKPDTFITIPADPRPKMPRPASAKLHWEHKEESIDYIATASHVDVRSNTNALIAQMFSLSYIACENDEPNTKRPVTFMYNGGPGCASVPINFGGMGPKCIKTNGTKHLNYQAELLDNPYTLLKESDLVFFDAPGTGWSAFAEDADAKKYFGIDEDADAFARAIMQWLEDNGRWNSPVFIFGESYGTIRSAVLMRLLGERGVHVAGVVMLSSIFNWTMTLPDNDYYYLGMLPTFAATAQYFKRAGEGIDENTWFDQAMQFTEEVYAPALLLGDRISKEKMHEVAQGMEELIGLPASYIEEKKLRISLDMFRFQILRDEEKVCGRLDTRFTSYIPHPAQTEDAGADSDPSDDAIESTMTMAFRNFCHETLGYHPPAAYMGNNYASIGVHWNWKHEAPGTAFAVSAPNVAFDIATALKRSPTTHIAFLGGRFDAATTLWNTYHDISALFLPEEIKENTHWYRYGCGHMAYIDIPTLQQMSKDLHEFYTAALEI